MVAVYFAFVVLSLAILNSPLTRNIYLFRLFNKSHDDKNTHICTYEDLLLLLLLLLCVFPFRSHSFAVLLFWIFTRSSAAAHRYLRCTHSVRQSHVENRLIYMTLYDVSIHVYFYSDVCHYWFRFRAFVRILCVCCPRKIRKKYQPTMRSKASQVSIKMYCKIFQTVCSVMCSLVNRVACAFRRAGNMVRLYLSFDIQ